MRIGISVRTHHGQNPLQDASGQAAFFLASLLQRLTSVDSVVLIGASGQACTPLQAGVAGHGFDCVSLQEAADLADVVIETAGTLDPQWLRLMRARGKKVVWQCCEQPYAPLVEGAVFDQPGFFRAVECDEIWLFPKHEELAPVMRTLYRRPVQVSPLIWQPQFLQERIDEVARSSGLRYGYRPAVDPDRQGWRVAICEANVSVVGSVSLSMLVCEEAYRAEPSSVDMMSVLNTSQMVTHPTLLYFANSLDLVRHHKAVFLGGHDLVAFLTANVDAVVSHQWQDDQSYDCLSALYGNYPLIHNSRWLHDLSGAGYYYPMFDAAEGGRQLRLARTIHASSLADYSARSGKVFDTVSPANPQNLQAYEALLRNLCGSSGGEPG